MVILGGGGRFLMSEVSLCMYSCRGIRFLMSEVPLYIHRTDE